MIDLIDSSTVEHLSELHLQRVCTFRSFDLRRVVRGILGIEVDESRALVGEAARLMLEAHPA
jgi:hypothetical protein